jgi:hypothetical protein
VAKNYRVTTNEYELDEFNIGTNKEPKFVKISKSLSPENREKYLELMRQFYDVLAWSYEHMKVYDKINIHHIIPIK